MEWLIQLCIVIFVACVIFWLVMTYLIPALPPPLQNVVKILFILICIIFLASYFFAWGDLPYMHHGTGRR